MILRDSSNPCFTAVFGCSEQCFLYRYYFCADRVQASLRRAEQVLSCCDIVCSKWCFHISVLHRISRIYIFIRECKLHPSYYSLIYQLFSWSANVSFFLLQMLKIRMHADYKLSYSRTMSLNWYIGFQWNRRNGKIRGNPVARKYLVCLTKLSLINFLLIN